MSAIRVVLRDRATSVRKKIKSYKSSEEEQNFSQELDTFIAL